MDEEANIILGDIVSFCQRDNQDTRLINMMSRAKPVGLTDDAFVIEVPSRFAYSYLMKQRQTIETYLEEITFSPMALDVIVTDAPVAPSAGGIQQTTPVAQKTPTTDHVSRETSLYDSNGAVNGAERAISTPENANENLETKAVSAARNASAPNTGAMRITNTLSVDEFKKMMANLDGSKRTMDRHSSPATAQEAEPEPLSPREAASADFNNSKFTFENFVFGRENMLAYRGALQFVASVDTPGVKTMLFIYGKSGLGKTHLLLAIKNDLNEKRPDIKVKYANSQTYIDDFINEVAMKKSTGVGILRDYHEADVLIIDDIQNIIGKSASIDYFFSLMDEFIRENKKIVIAADRAPKDLGMDERLTSRFASGQLCPVYEPEYETRLQILTHYYENTILASSLAGQEGETSIANMVRAGGGHLSKEQLEHMAKRAGSNIRELESYCERCASESWDREQMGETLSFDDIERIANDYFDTVHKKISVSTVQEVCEAYYHISHEEIIGPRRNANIALARHVAIYLSINMCEMTSIAVGSAFGGRDHSTVLNSLKVIEKKLKTDRTLVDDLKQIRERIQQKA